MSMPYCCLFTFCLLQAKELGERDSHLACKEAELKSQESKLQQAQQLLQELDSRVTAVREQEQDLKKQQQDLEKREQDLSDRQATVDQHELQLKQRKAELAARAAELEHAQAEVQVRPSTCKRTCDGAHAVGYCAIVWWCLVVAAVCSFSRAWLLLSQNLHILCWHTHKAALHKSLVQVLSTLKSKTLLPPAVVRF